MSKSDDYNESMNEFVRGAKAALEKGDDRTYHYPLKEDCDCYGCEINDLKRQLAERDKEIERVRKQLADAHNAYFAVDAELEAEREKTRWRKWPESNPSDETYWPVLICNDDEGGDTFLAHDISGDGLWFCDDGPDRPVSIYRNWLPVSPLCPIPAESKETPADGSSGYSEAPERAVVFYQEGDDPFICHYAGHPDAIEGIESELSYQEWPHGDGEYTFDCYYMDGREPGESKGWDLYLRGFSSIPTEEG